MEKTGKEKLGIPTTEKDFIKIVNSPVYYEPLRKGLKLIDIEYKVLQSVKNQVAEWFEEIYLRTGEKADIQFINYGDTELVFVASFGEKKYTMLVSQPTVPRGKVKQEVELLKKYARIRKSVVVAPLAYYPVIHPYNDEKNDYFYSFFKEAYITPYHMQASCVASEPGGFGIYVPEPEYHFEKFTDKESEMVCSCMIAQLIYLYDDKTKAGISACKLGGGDFILTKDWDRENLSAVDTLQCMKLTTVREEVHCTFNDYVALVRDEFSRQTITDHSGSSLINHKAMVGIKPAVIEKGVKLGKKLREIAKKNAMKKTASKKQPISGLPKKEGGAISK